LKTDLFSRIRVKKNKSKKKCRTVLPALLCSYFCVATFFMSRGHRRWCFTLNNVEIVDGSLVLLQPDRWPSCTYCVYQAELGDEGQHLHFQGYVVFRNAKTLAAVRALTGLAGKLFFFFFFFLLTQQKKVLILKLREVHLRSVMSTVPKRILVMLVLGVGESLMGAKEREAIF